jgi:hypothetical protein
VGIAELHWHGPPTCASMCSDSVCWVWWNRIPASLLHLNSRCFPVERDRRGIADHEAALAQVFHFQRGNLRIGLGVVVDEIMQIGSLVGVDAPENLALVDKQTEPCWRAY